MTGFIIGSFEKRVFDKAAISRAVRLRKFWLRIDSTELAGWFD